MSNAEVAEADFAPQEARDEFDQRRHAEQSLSRRMDEQAALYELTDRLHRAGSLDDVYLAALDAIVRALRCDRASILLFDKAGVMRFAAWRGLSDAYRVAVEGHSPWTPDARHPPPICVDDVETADLGESLRATVKAERIGALAFIPLVANAKLVGKFMTYYEQPHVFTEAEVDLAITIARQLGFGVERMRAEEARRAAEEELRESERRLEFALAAGRMGAWEWNIATGQIIWSPGLEEIHGLAPGTFGGTYEDFKREILPDDLPSVRERIEQSIATGRDYHVRYRMQAPGGEIRWLEAFGRLAFDADGQPIRLAGVCMDVTDNKQAEESLVESERRFKTLASEVPVGIFQTDADGNCLFVNEQWLELAGISSERALGRGWIEALHPDDRNRVENEWHEAANSARPFASEYRFRTPAGQVAWLKGSAVALRDGSGRVTDYIGSVIDITERKRAEEQQLLLINELNHRVKNTLATVQAIAAQTMRGAKIDPSVQESLEARLIALSNAHSILTQENWEGAELRRVIAQALEPHASPERLRLEGPRVRLVPRSAVAVAMGMHELATNAAKYGALSNGTGQVAVTWTVDASVPALLRLEWKESGGPRVTAPRRRGFGSRLIEKNLAHDLDGRAKIHFHSEGVACTIVSRLQSAEA
jgi:PAS domain S-box-containing protein